MPITDGVKEYIVNFRQILLPIMKDAVWHSPDKSLRQLLNEKTDLLRDALTDSSGRYNNQYIEALIARLINFCLDPVVKFKSSDVRTFVLKSLFSFRYEDCSGLIKLIDEGMLLNHYMLDNDHMNIIDARGEVRLLMGGIPEDMSSKIPVLWCWDENKVGAIRPCNDLSANENPIRDVDLQRLLPSLPHPPLETLAGKLQQINDVYGLSGNTEELCSSRDIRLGKVSTGRKLLCIVTPNDEDECYSHEIIEKATLPHSRLNAICHTALVSAAHGYISGISNLIEETLPQRGYSKECALSVSVLFYCVSYFVMELKKQQWNESANAYQASSIATACNNTVFIILANVAIAAIGMLIHMLSHMLHQKGCQKTAKAVGVVAPYLLSGGFFAMGAAKSGVDNVVTAAVVGGLAREGTKMVGGMVLRRR